MNATGTVVMPGTKVVAPTREEGVPVVPKSGVASAEEDTAPAPERDVAPEKVPTAVEIPPSTLTCLK